MKKAVDSAFDDEEEGVANSAASLGPDGGPASPHDDAEDPESGDDELDEIADFDEDSWLDEELSEEELAALGDDEFDEEDGGEEDIFSADDLSDLSEEDVGEIGRDDAFGALDDEFSPDEPFEIAAEDDQESLTAEHGGFAVEPAPAATGSEVVEYDVAVGELIDEDTDCRPVPRVSIHAFCETPATTELLEKAAIDRRLSKAHLTIHMGGVAKAIDHFRATATPNLIILETVVSGAELFAQLGELAEYCDPSTKVIIIGQVNDIILYRELMRQGISEYIVQPQSPLQIIKSIANLYVDPSAPPIGKTVAFVGARGGVGSSTIAHNVAWSTAEDLQSDTIILDLDLPFGTASLDFEEDPTSGLVEALSSPERLDDVLLDRLLQKHTDRLSLFTAPNLLDREYELDDQAFETVIDIVRNSAPTIVIDVPHMWTSWAKRILQSSDEIVITTTPDLAAFRNTKNLIDVVNGARPNDAPPHLVINQYDPKISAVQPEQFVEHVGVEPSLVIGWEPQLFNTAATNASPIAEVGPKTKTAQGFRDISARLIGRTDALLSKPRFSLAGLFKKKR
ncbi:MAG: CpaE family protein [Parvularculaceae bacterium]